MHFADREEAGRFLAKRLCGFYASNTVIVALPCGGAIVGAVLARELHLPLGFVLTNKISHPYARERAVGAMAEGGVLVYDSHVAGPVPAHWRHLAESRVRRVLRSRRAYYTHGHTRPIMRGKTVILVDDGMVTGLSMDAAVMWARERGARRIVVAVPVASSESTSRLAPSVDKIIVLTHAVQLPSSVAAYYGYFPYVTDEEAQAVFAEAYHGV